MQACERKERFHNRCGYCLERRTICIYRLEVLKKKKKNKVTRDHAENENEEERKDEFHADSMINYAHLQHLRSFSGGHFHLASNYRFYPVALRLKITLLLFCNEKYY